MCAHTHTHTHLGNLVSCQGDSLGMLVVYYLVMLGMHIAGFTANMFLPVELSQCC